MVVLKEIRRTMFGAALCMAVCLALLLMPFVTLASEGSGTYSDAGLDPPAVTVTGELPSSYDLRDRGLTTSIKNQYYNGTCWCFAAAAAAETSIIAAGLSNDSVDVSEVQLDYFIFDRVADPSGGTSGDKIKNITGYSALNSGGEAYMTTFALSTWMGVCRDSSTVPYADYTSSTVLSDDLAYGHDIAHLQNARWVNTSDHDSMKHLIEQGAAPIICYYCGDWQTDYRAVSGMTGTNTTCYLTPTADNENVPDHEVVIVGWNDCISAEYFTDENGEHPAGDGAWLVKNCWGVNGDPDGWISSDGYFWLSYYHQQIDEYAVFLYFQSPDNYDHNYQYDGGASTNQDISVGASGAMANIFKSGGNEDLKAVSFYMTRNAGVEYSIQIYTGIRDATDPTSGTAALSTPQTGTTTYAGYYTVDLDQTVRLSKGETFAVVIEVRGSDGNIYVPVDTNETRSESGYGFTDCITSAAAGQSFVYKAGVWTDIGSDGSSNLRIKAFTDDATDNTALYATCAAVAALAVMVIFVCRPGGR
jgi:C1A family cysteine protease